VAALINDVNPLRPCGIRVIRSVAHIVDSERQGELESLGEIIRDRHALLERFRLRVANVVLDIGFHLPFVGGMRLANVNGQEIRTLFVVLKNLNDVAYLAAKRRSGKTPEHQHQRPLMGSFANVKTANAIQRDNPRIRRIAAHFERAAMHVREGVSHHPVGVLGAPRHERQHGKSGNEQHAKNARYPFPETIHAALLQQIDLSTHQEEKLTGSRRTENGPARRRKLALSHAR